MGVGGGEEEKGGPDTKPFSKSCEHSEVSQARSLHAC